MSKRILCYGDSNTWGAIPGGDETTRYPEDVRWTSLLNRILGEDYQIIEEGYCGRTTVFDDVVENRVSGLTYFAPCIASHSPLDLIIIMLGTNDLKRKFGVGARSSVIALQQYLTTLRNTPMAGEDPKVLIVAPPVIEEDYKNVPMFLEMYGNTAHEDSLKFAEEYETFARDNHLEFFNAAAYVKASPVDGIHLTEEGHKILAEKLAETISALIG
jgi:lysophospholipase L1-like esterase